MIKYLLGIALAFVAVTANAQNTSANAQTDVRSSAGANAQTNGNAQNISFNSPDEVKYSGSYTARIAPSIVMGGFAGSFSSNNCANTTQGGLSVPGGGLGFGKAVESMPCNHRQNGVMFSQQAVTYTQMGQREKALQLMVMADYEFCLAGNETTIDACQKLKILAEGEK